MDPVFIAAYLLNPIIYFTPLESPGIYAGDVINRKHQLLVKAGSKPRLSKGVYFIYKKTNPETSY